MKTGPLVGTFLPQGPLFRDSPFFLPFYAAVSLSPACSAAAPPTKISSSSSFTPDLLHISLLPKQVAAMSRSKVQKADDDDMDPTQYFENRVKTLGALKSAGINPYPHKFHVSMSIPEYIENYKGLTNEECLEDVEVSLAGRIMNKRSCSAKLFFYDLHGNGAKVQVMARVQDMTNARVSEVDRAEFSKLHSGVKRGDVVGVIGYPARGLEWSPNCNISPKPSG